MKQFKKFLNIDSLIIISSMVLIFAFALIPLCDPDMFFHIKNGEYIWFNGLPKYDPYSIHFGLIYIQHEWLSDIIFYLIYSIAGFESLFIFKIIMFYLWFFTFYKLNMLFNDGNKELSFALTTFSSFFFIPFVNIRPQTFSIELLMLEILMLERYNQTIKLRYLCLLPFFALMLVNLHGAAVLFFYIPIVFYILSNIFYFEFRENSTALRIDFKNKVITLNLLVTSIISFLVMLINPNNIKSVLYSLNAFSDKTWTQNILEMQPLSINSTGSIIFGIFAIMALVMIFTRKPILLKQLLFVGFGIFIALSAIRFIVYFFVFAIPFFTHYLSSIKFIQNKKEKENWLTLKLKKRIGYGLLFGTIIFLMLQLQTNKLQATNFEKYPVGAVSVLQKEKNIRLFNEFGIGHYLIFNNIKVFVDGRAEMYCNVYNNTEVYYDYIKAYTGKVWPKDIFDKYHFTHFIVGKDSIPEIFLQNDKSYEKIYEDKNYVLFRLKRLDIQNR